MVIKCKKVFYDDDGKNILFKKGNYYEFEEEHLYNEKCIWVIFNKYGKKVNVGRRFFYKKGIRTRYIYEYFENLRKTKLKKINEKSI